MDGTIAEEPHGLRFERVSYAYDTAAGAVRALQGVDLSVERGELVAVVGPNGSGKSTLALLANGLLVPRDDDGRVTVDGIDTTDVARAWDVRTRVGVVFQNPDNQIVGTVVEEDVAFGPENLGFAREEIRRRVDGAVATVGLTGMERREPHLLSGGQKQRLAIAGVLALRPDYLVLDEPTAMLDASGRDDVLSVIGRLRQAGHGILHITHHLDDVVSADRVMVLCEGAVAFRGTPAELFRESDHLEAWGLTLPPMARLKAALERIGRPVAEDAWSPHEVVESLWR